MDLQTYLRYSCFTLSCHPEHAEKDRLVLLDVESAPQLLLQICPQQPKSRTVHAEYYISN